MEGRTLVEFSGVGEKQKEERELKLAQSSAPDCP